METTFSALSVFPSLSRSASTSGDYTSNSRSRSKEERKINKWIMLLVRREPDGKNIFKYLTCNEFGCYTSKFPKRVNK